MKRIGTTMVLGFLLASHAGLAATTPPARRDAASLLHRIRRLSVVGSVLYVAAHPDDENTELLAYFANEKLVRAAYLSLTRGEGGQNLIGPEQGPLLGMIRTQELLAARRLDGAEQFFTRARDFGFSKSVDETLATWGEDAVLADMVWVIRNVRPDVLISRFPLEAGGTHGHHTASARLAVEAFHKAADPAFHPEQLERVGTWQAKRIVWNSWPLDPKGKADASAPLTLNAGGFNPLLGLSYGELAAESRSMHKSQGFGAAPSRGPAQETFRLLAGEAGSSLLDGVDLTWGRVPGAQNLAALFQQAASEFRVDSPHSVLPTLLLVLEELRKLPASPWKAQKEKELAEVIVDCAGLFVEATATEFSVAPGHDLEVNAVALNRSPAALTLREVRLTGAAPLAVEAALEADKAVPLKTTLKVPAEAALSNPYWLDAPPDKGTWRVANPALIGMPELPSPLQAEFVLSAGNQRFSVMRAVAYKWTDPTAGERYRAIEVVPPVMVNTDASILMFPDAAPKELHVVLTAGAANVQGELRPELPKGWISEPASLPFTLGKKGGEEEFRFRIRPAAPLHGGASKSDTLRIVAETGGQTYSRGLVRIEHPHIPIQTLLPPAVVKLVLFDLAKGRTRLGYIPGAGDDVPAALHQVGYDVTLLGDEALRTKPLSPYDAIVVGIRAYNTNPRMPVYYKRLMEYVAGGGTLVVQYNTNNRLSSVPLEIGPYLFEISRDRVTDETAEVVFEAPKHRILTSPNALRPADFEGWIQERGLYFAAKWDGHYEPVLSMHDPGEPATKGSLLVTKYGKGAFIYTGLAFFRQLPAGVPGAYRLFANLLSYGH